MFSNSNAYVDNSVLDCSILSALAMEIIQSCTKPLMWFYGDKMWCLWQGYFITTRIMLWNVMTYPYKRQESFARIFIQFWTVYWHASPFWDPALSKHFIDNCDLLKCISSSIDAFLCILLAVYSYLIYVGLLLISSHSRVNKALWRVWAWIGKWKIVTVIRQRLFMYCYHSKYRIYVYLAYRCMNFEYRVYYNYRVYAYAVLKVSVMWATSLPNYLIKRLPS